MTDSDQDKKKKGPKLFKPGEVPGVSKEKKEGPKLFKPGAGGPKPLSGAPSKGPKLFKPGAESAPKPKSEIKATEKKAPKLFKPSAKSPVKPPEPSQKKGPKLFKPGAVTPEISEKPQVKGPKLFKPESAAPSAPKKPSEGMEAVSKPKMVTPSKPISKGPKLFKPGKPEMKPEKKAEAAPVTPSPAPKPTKPVKKPKLFKSAAPSAPAETKPVAEEKPASPVAAKKAEPVKKVKVKEPKISKRVPEKVKKEKKEKKETKEKKEKKSISAADLLSLTEEVEAEEAEEKKKPAVEKALTPQDKAALRKKQREQLKAEKAERRKFIRQRLYLELDVRKMYYKAMFSAFMGVILMMIFVYIISCFEDNTFLVQGKFLSVYAQGNPLNEAVGVWTIAYTPLMAFNKLDPMWMDNWYYYIAPVLLVAMYFGWQIKHPKYAIIASIFFIMWSMMLAFAVLTIFPLFGWVDPSAIDAGLSASYPAVIDSFNSLANAVEAATHSVFFAWIVEGAIENGLLIAAITIPFSIIFALFHQVLGKKK